MNETLPTLLNQSQPVWFRPWRFDAAGQVLHLPQQTSASRPSRRSCRDCEKNLSNRNERKLCPAKLSLVRRGGTLCQVRNTSFWFSASCTLPPPTLIVQQSANEAQILSPQPVLHVIPNAYTPPCGAAFVFQKPVEALWKQGGAKSCGAMRSRRRRTRPKPIFDGVGLPRVLTSRTDPYFRYEIQGGRPDAIEQRVTRQRPCPTTKQVLRALR